MGKSHGRSSAVFLAELYPAEQLWLESKWGFSSSIQFHAECSLIMCVSHQVPCQRPQADWKHLWLARKWMALCPNTRGNNKQPGTNEFLIIASDSWHFFPTHLKMACAASKMQRSIWFWGKGAQKFSLQWARVMGLHTPALCSLLIGHWREE